MVTAPGDPCWNVLFRYEPIASGGLSTMGELRHKSDTISGQGSLRSVFVAFHCRYGYHTNLYPKLPIIVERQQSAYLYPLGFVFVAVVRHTINWPLSYFLAWLPCLKTVL